MIDIIKAEIFDTAFSSGSYCVYVHVVSIVCSTADFRMTSDHL